MIDRPDLIADLVEDLRLANGRVRELERELANRDVDIRALEARADHFRAQLVTFENRTLRAEQTAEDMHNRILSIYRSTSWRLGGPMRRIMRMVRRLAGLPA